MAVEFLEQIGSGVTIAILTAFLTVKLSLKQFRSERLWDKKIEAYERIIEALHNSKRYSMRCLGELYSDSVSAKGEGEKARERVSQAFDEITKAADVGAFLLSQESVDRLRKYKKDREEAERASSWENYLDAEIDATKSCLEDLIGLAKKDLQK